MKQTKKREKTIITAEIFQRTLVRSRRATTLAWCEKCQAQVWMLTPNEAAALACTSVRNLFRRVEAGELHFVETTGGALLVCRNSLAFQQPTMSSL